MSSYKYFHRRARSSMIHNYTGIRDEIARSEFVFENDRQAIENLPELNGNLGDYLFRIFASNPSRVVLVDYTMQNPKKVRACHLLALCIFVSKRIKQHVEERRIGIALPAGMYSCVANIALFLADKIPVNLNFALGRNAVESALDQAGIRTVISTNAILEKFPQFPWSENVFDICKIISGLGKFSLLKLISEIYITPTKTLAKRYKVPTKGGDNEAVLLFSSGTTGKPKGIVLSHKNIISNCVQIWLAGILRKTDSLLSCLPVFHSFGMTINVWFCLLFGIRTATYANPLEAKTVSSIIEKEKLTFNSGTPTFFKQYLSKVEPNKLRSLRAVMVGGECVTVDLIDAWEKMFHGEMVAGYGLTEASPAVAINFPSGIQNRDVGRKKGSVGRVMPGLSVKFIGPETGKLIPLGETGILCLKGPNVFHGYLNNEADTERVLLDGWLITGDLARLDADGFLYIDGRIARFSKVGGEMIPHVGVEEAISKILSLTHERGPEIAVMSRMNKKKGENLVLLSERELDMRSLREKLLQYGLPTLWIPKECVVVDDIPALATGKLDLAACKQLLESKFP
ncbi:MAG: AMP-binding protein [Puniceicoccales bacterium]|jgi:acyl-[acyl-carrier-protein]-phospholipid O-acyltransferase/long-chain-fatty-acid--[acyl-carrier-protein] ligase|nr:AMP-binding protein [Puniceicoccales bacterium]